MQHDQIFCATGRSDNGRAYWSDEAVSLGYKSESAWKKSGRKVLPSAVPSVVVGQVSRGVGRPLAPILRDLGKDEYDYAADYFFVYAESDTVVSGSTGGSSGSQNGKTEDQPTATTTECSPPAILPYVAGFFDKSIQGKDLAKTDLATSKSVISRPSRRDRKAEEWGYLPEGFDWSRVPKPLVGGMKYQTSQEGATVLMLLPLWRKYDWFGAYVVKYAEVRLPAVPVVSVGFGPMAGRKCGNTNWYSEYETILAIFRPNQQGFLGDWITP